MGVGLVQGWGWEGLACLQEDVCVCMTAVWLAACRARHPFVEGVQLVAGLSPPHLVVRCVRLAALLVCLQGKTSLEGVQLVADLVRKKRCVLDPSVVGALLVLRFEAVTPTQQGGEGVGRQAQKVRGSCCVQPAGIAKHTTQQQQ